MVEHLEVPIQHQSDTYLPPQRTTSKPQAAQQGRNSSQLPLPFSSSASTSTTTYVLNASKREVD